MSDQDRETTGPNRPEVDETSENEQKERVEESEPVGDARRISTFRNLFTTPLDDQAPAPTLGERTRTLPETKSNPDLQEEDQEQEAPASQPDSHSERSLGSTSSSILGQELEDAFKLDGAPGARTLRVIESRVNDAVGRATTEAITNISAMVTSMTEAYEKRLMDIAERQFEIVTDMLAERIRNFPELPADIQPRKTAETFKGLQADK